MKHYTRTILIVASYPDSIWTFRGNLIAAMQVRSMAVHVAAPGLEAGIPLRIDLERRGLVVHDLPLQRTGTNLRTDLVLVWHLWRLMRRIKPDVVLSYTVKPVVYGSIAAWLARVPRRFALVTGLGYAFIGRRRGALVAIVRALYAVALGRVAKIFFQNPDDERLFRKLGLVKPKVPSIVVNGSGVDIEFFAPAALPPGPITFLMIARLLGNKGVREYAAAAKSVRESHPVARFVLVGWVDESPDAIAQSELDAWVSDGTIEFLGKLSDVRSPIAASSVYVLPSYREGTPRTVLEAMAMGRAVITTDAPGCRQTVRDGDNGFLVPVKSVTGLVEAMLKFIEQPALVARMGARARQIAAAKYDVNNVNEMMLREMGIFAPAEHESSVAFSREAKVR